MKKSVFDWFFAVIVAAGVLSSRAAESVSYLDWSVTEKKLVEKTCTEYEVVTADTATFENGKWYVVNSTVSRESIAVSGTAHLILCDGAKLMASCGAYDMTAGLDVSGENSLSIYGQREGTGELWATGGRYCAGIGGAYARDAGVLTVNGGIVTAQGDSKGGAGIGGGCYGRCGAVTVNGGVVTAQGGSYGGAGIGGGIGEMVGGHIVEVPPCGTVTVNGGAVTATGGTGAAGIGGGAAGVTCEMVAVRGGRVKAVGRDVADIGPGEGVSGGSVSISGGVFARGLQSGWLAEGCLVTGNTDPSTSSDYPVAVVRAVIVTVGTHENMSAAWTSGDGSKTNTVSNGSFTVFSGTADVRVIFRPADGYALEGASVCELGTVTEDVVLKSGQIPVARLIPVAYVDADGEVRTVESYSFVTAATAAFADNGWYVVRGSVSRGTIAVSGSAHLVLCDGSMLAVQGADGEAGVSVGAGASLTVYGQERGDGTLTSRGGKGAAGIGGGNVGACGTVVINGGTVTATGGTVDDVTVYSGAGIGGGCRGSCDTVTVRGGTVTATGGAKAAGIGGGYLGACGAVTVTGGRVKATGGGPTAADIGGGEDGAGGTVSISGGVFVRKPSADWCAKGFGAFANPDEATRTAYPWAVLPAYEVTVGELEGMTASWTSGDGSATNAVDGSVFKVPQGASVTVLFAPAAGHWLDGNAVCELGEVTGDVDIRSRLPVVRDPIAYVDASGEARAAMPYAVVTGGTSAFVDGGWYAVTAAVSCATITVEGEAHLVLCDGASLTAAGTASQAGIAVGAGGILHIYGQTGGTGALKATGGSDGSGLSGRFAISGGVFARKPDSTWLAAGHAVFTNPDKATSAAYPWAVLRSCTMTVGELENMTAVWTSGDGSVTNAVDGGAFPVPHGVAAKVIFTPKFGFVFTDGGAVCDLGTVTEDVDISGRIPKTSPGVEYIDANGVLQQCLTFTVVTADTATFTNGGWYVASKTVKRRTITVDGSAHLILCDGALLDLQGDTTLPGLRVTSRNSITIYGQREGTGKLVARVSFDATSRYPMGAGIGGGEDESGGTVTINGGTVEATGIYGAGIGGGNSRSGGTVTINGGTVEASSSMGGAGIGGGAGGAGGTVKICGGCVKATGASGGIGSGEGATVAGTVSITGGCFGMTVQKSWLASGLVVIANQDAATCKRFPWMVAPGYQVTVGELENMTAVWTCEGSGVTNAVTSTAFNVPRDATLTILFTAQTGYFFDGERSASLTRTVKGDLDLRGQIPKAEPSAVEYLDANGALCTVAPGHYTLVTAKTTTLGDGWYVVSDANVSRGSLSVTGNAHLILVDGTSLVVQGSDGEAGLCVPVGESITIYGQRKGTGVLKATGGCRCAGIGGGNRFGGCGTVTVNGGTVTATGGGEGGAGIGGGEYGAGGTVTVNGGTVTATGCHGGAGIGGGYGADGGTVTINGGTVKAMGSSSKGGSAGIGGGGDSGAGGTVVIRGGRVLANGQDGADDIGSGSTRYGEKMLEGKTSISGGIFGMGLKNGWIEERHLVLANADPKTSKTYPWAVVPACRVTVGELKNLSVAWTFGDGSVTNAASGTSFLVPSNMSNKVVFTPAKGYWLDGESVCELGVVTGDIDITDYVPVAHQLIEYIDANGELQRVQGYTVVTENTATFTNGGWYVVNSSVKRDTVTVSGGAHLILCDGSELSLQGGEREPGLFVSEGNSITVFGQRKGTGKLQATGGMYGAGIGGGDEGVGGMVTVNGGMVTATGGRYGAGIGGGGFGAGGTVTVNGGMVTATGGMYGAGIGGGDEGAGGMVTIKGGAVTATGDGCSGIGGGRLSADDGMVSITGGIFAQELDLKWLAESCAIFDNSDEKTQAAYPWLVAPACKMTVGKLDNMAVAWTFGDGSVTNAASGPSFFVYSNTPVTVVFTPMNGYWLDGKSVWEFDVVTEDRNLTGRVVARPNLAYVQEDGKGGTVSGYAVVHDTTNTFGTGWYAVLDTDVRCDAIAVNGAAKLLLCNGTKLSVPNGIAVADGASLAIYGQEGNAGFLDAQGGAGEPGIGGAGSVTIVGGTVTAVGGEGDGVPGIGGANPVVIRGGSVGASVANAQDASGTPLWCVTVEGLGASAPTFANLPGGYGTGGITPVGGEVWLWWPNGTYSIKVSGTLYYAVVKNANAVAAKSQWEIGEGVMAAWADGVLTISGAGNVNDFASVDALPWQGLVVTNVTIPETVKPGRNLLAGLGDATTVNSAVPVSLIRQLSGDFLVGEVAPAEATALEIDGGHIRMRVGVAASTELNEEGWTEVKVDGVEKLSDGGAVLTVPVQGQRGFYRLKSR